MSDEFEYEDVERSKKLLEKLREEKGFLDQDAVLKEIDIKNPLDEVRKGLDRAIVGEEENKLLLWLIAVSKDMEEPLHASVEGESGIGKTYLVMNVTNALPSGSVVKLTRVTPAFLDYVKDKLKHKVLLVQQMGGAESAKDSLHVLMTEKGLKLGTVKQGKGGIYEPYEVEAEGPISFISTTVSSINLDEQFRTRVWRIFPDSSEEQTKRIQEHTALLKKKPWLKEEVKEELKKVSDFVTLLEKKGIRKVIVPYADKIILPSKRARVRRDQKKILELIEVIAYVNQFNRYIVEIYGEKYIIANEEDFKEALRIAKESLASTVKDLSKREEEIMEICKELENKGEEITSRSVARATRGRLSQVTVRKYLEHLVDLGYLYVEEESSGRSPKIYSVNWEREDLPIFGDNIDLSVPDSPEELKSYLKLCCDIDILDKGIYRYDDELNLLPIPNISLSQQEKEQESSPSEQNEESLPVGMPNNDNLTVISSNNDKKGDFKGLFKLTFCPYCTAKFASQKDLQAHIRHEHKEVSKPW